MVSMTEHEYGQENDRSDGNHQKMIQLWFFVSGIKFHHVFDGFGMNHVLSLLFLFYFDMRFTGMINLPCAKDDCPSEYVNYMITHPKNKSNGFVRE